MSAWFSPKVDANAQVSLTSPNPDHFGNNHDLEPVDVSKVQKLVLDTIYQLQEEVPGLLDVVRISGAP